MIEEDSGVRRMLRHTLRSAGFDATESLSGAEAIEVLEHQPPEAVVLETWLKDGLGSQILERLRELNKKNINSTIWVVMSTLDREDVEKELGPLGARFLAKPFDPWELVRILRGQLFVAKDAFLRK
ncbi:MAG: response regulator [Dehalococcoidia bacterium]